MIRQTLIVAASLLILIAACKKDGGSNNTGAYNGFKVDGVTYGLDTIERNFWYTGGALRIRSKDNGGALIYFRRGGNEWPSADGVYQFDVTAGIGFDTSEVHFCFDPDNTSESYCSVTGGTPTKLTLTITNGHWALDMPPTIAVDNSVKIVEISLHD